jgi:hypothetical protein
MCRIDGEDAPNAFSGWGRRRDSRGRGRRASVMRRVASGWWCRQRGRISAPRIFFQVMLTPREQGDIGELSAM